METFLNNPWIIGIGTAVIAGLILKILVKSKTPKAPKLSSTAILNKGRGNTFDNNTVVGYDVGLEDQGENTKATNNKFIK